MPDEPKPRRKIVVEPIGGSWDDLLSITKELNEVRVTIRCGKCGRIVSRNGLAWGDQRGRLSCKVHGPLGGDITVEELHAEWTRRNKPSSFGIKRNPVT
jgi:hypothetical protein